MRVSASSTVWHDRSDRGPAVTRVSDAGTDTKDFVVERSTAPQPDQRERRLTEMLANARALKLGLAAQMLATHPVTQTTPALPLPPAARGAARYATTAEGADQAMRLGFARAV